jgi:isopenicillin-N epimerase
MTSPVRHEWSLPDDVTYLNHGSFGPSPEIVRESRERWSARLERQPMQFLVRETEQLLDTACTRLGELVGSRAGNLTFVDNATFGMNIVAESIELQPGDEVLLTDHEYGAVQRIWRHACRRAGARLVIQPLPLPFESPVAVVDQFMAGVTERTRLIVFSHISSPTAVILPAQQICDAARQRGIPVAIDGPHAVAMIPLDLKDLGCDFYTASCHKWLCGPFGSGFLYVQSRQQPTLKPRLISWGGSISGRDAHWKDEHRWLGTRDPAPFLAVPDAIHFMRNYGLKKFRTETHEMAQYARNRILEVTGLEPIVPDSADWYGSMIAMPLPIPFGWVPPTHGKIDPLQLQLLERKIEAPVFSWNDQRFIRVSCHLYNSTEDVDRLVDLFPDLLAAESQTIDPNV